MGTEVIRPHDILSGGRLGAAPSTTGAAFLPRQRQNATTFPGAGPNPRPNRRPEPRKPKHAKNSGGSGGSLEMGQVTILKRGQALDMKAGGGLRGKARKEWKRGGEGGAGVLSSEAGGGGDLIGLEIGLLAPEPKAVPKQTGLAELKTGAKPRVRAEKYAGPAFSTSPSPTKLPLPTFSCRRAADYGGDAVDLLATRDLRRLLRLD